MESLKALDKGLVERMHEGLLRIRLFEETQSRLFKAGEQEGFTHLYLGEEAIAVGACLALNPDDFITSTHRGHGHMIAKGGDFKKMFAELYGRTPGACLGRSGSLHIADRGIGMLGANGLVGDGNPIAVGAGYSIRLRGTKQVVVSFFGDGASNQGTFHESLNMAASFDLPVIFVLENNGMSCGTITASVCKVLHHVHAVDVLPRNAVGHGPVAQVLQKEELTTLVVGLIRFQGRFRIDQPVILAGIFASMVPMVILYLVGQRFLVQGLTAGALKGE